MQNIPSTILSACPSCESTNLFKWGSSTDRDMKVSAELFSYEECTACGVVFQNPQIAPHYISTFYPVQYAPHRSHAANKEYVIPKNPRKIARWPYTKRKLLSFGEGHGRTFLDYGCGSPAHLDVMRALGWKTIGADFSKDSVDAVEASGHRGIHTLEDLNLEKIGDQTLDLILLNHVFEHVYNPVELLQIFLKKLRPKGFIHLVLPNPQGISSRLFKSSWYGLEAPRHIILYPPERLSKLGQSVGFQFAALEHENIAKDFSRSFGYALQDLGLLKNVPSHAFLNSRLLNALFKPITSLFSRLGKGDRFHLTLQKP